MLTKKNILITDDDPDIVLLIQGFIEKNFKEFKVFTAQDGAKVLQMLTGIEFEFLFLDINMPRIDGRKVLSDINFLPKQNRPPHIFIITAEPSSNVEINSPSRKIYYFNKPIDFEKLKSSINNILHPTKAEAQPKPPALEVKFMNPFIDSTLSVLKITTGTEAVKEEINVAKGDGFKGDISAFYPIHSPMMEGFFCLSFPKSTYLKLMSRMLYQEFDEINDDNRDGVGELCNQIFGNAKAFFNDKFNTQIKMSTPSITVSDNHQVVSVLKSPRVVVKFNTDCGHFYVEVSISKVS